jgi:hypothetical protein
MPWPRVVLLEVSATDAMLFRYAVDGSFCGDTWHDSEAAARESAAREYEGLISEWTPVPSDVDATEFVIGAARGDN